MGAGLFVGIFFALAFAAAVAGGLYLLARSAGSVRTGGRAKLQRTTVRAYARRFLRRFPDTKAPSLRETLRQEFLPERQATPDDDHAYMGGFLFGLTGWFATKAVQSGYLAASDAERKRIAELIDEVVDEVCDDV